MQNGMRVVLKSRDDSYQDCGEEHLFLYLTIASLENRRIDSSIHSILDF